MVNEQTVNGLKVCVFCSASNRVGEEYKQMAHRLGEMIARAGHKLIYGGATGGLMTAVAEGAKAAGGNITGVITEGIARMGRQSDLPDRLLTTAGLAERKQVMCDESDCFIALPGGCGTLDELFSITAAGTIGEHDKPLFLVNTNGFFDLLLQEIEHMKAECFIPEQESYRPCVVTDITACMERLEHVATHNKPNEK